MAKITIIVGHSQQNTFCEALGQAYKTGAESAGNEVRIFVLSRLTFDPICGRAMRRPNRSRPIFSPHTMR